MEKKRHKVMEFLIIDDDEVSVMAIRRTLEALRIVNPVCVAKDGLEALEVLRGSLDADGVMAPHIITLDLSMPRMNGLEFLEEIRRDSRLHKAKIFVVTTSDDPSDIAYAYKNNIAGYIVKEDLGESFSEALSVLDEFSHLIVTEE